MESLSRPLRSVAARRGGGPSRDSGGSRAASQAVTEKDEPLPRAVFALEQVREEAIEPRLREHGTELVHVALVLVDELDVVADRSERVLRVFVVTSSRQAQFHELPQAEVSMCESIASVLAARRCVES